MAVSLRNSDSPLPTSALSCLSLQCCLCLPRAELRGEVALGRGLRDGGLEPEPEPPERSGREGLPSLLQRREGQAKGPTSPTPPHFRFPECYRWLAAEGRESFGSEMKCEF